MATSAEPLPSVLAAFDEIIDYAGLFPPARLSIEDALQEWISAPRSRLATLGWMLGRFVVDVARLEELDRAVGLLDAGDGICENIPLTVVVDGRSLPRNVCTESAAICALEFRLQEFRSVEEAQSEINSIAELAHTASYLNDDDAVFVELPRTSNWKDLMPQTCAELARQKLSAKIRCGGATADAFPAPRELAAFIAETRSCNLPFKATAGLHHPIRGFHEGFQMHGFLNVLTATAMAPNLAAPQLEVILEDEVASHFRFDSNGLCWMDQRISLEGLRKTRELFVSFGSCSFREPVAALRALGMIS